jgi:hypothetical protein
MGIGSGTISRLVRRAKTVRLVITAGNHAMTTNTALEDSGLTASGATPQSSCATNIGGLDQVAPRTGVGRRSGRCEQ